MKNFYRLSLPLVLAASIVAPVESFADTAYKAAVAKYQSAKQENPFPYAAKVQSKGMFDFSKKSDTKTRKAAPAAFDAVILPTSSETGYLDGPDGSSWFFTATYDVELIEHEYYTERRTRGYEYTIYDSNLKKIGTIKDQITLGEGETGVAAIMIGSQVTQKFFNYDSNYEVYVSIMLNTSSEMDYKVNTYSKAYSVGGKTDDKGNSVCLETIPGYPCAIINGAKDAWSEDFYITFITEETGLVDDYDTLTDYVMSCYQITTTYKKAGWGGGIQHINTTKTPLPMLPGDGMNTPTFLSFVKDGNPYFVSQHYDKMFFDNGVGPDETGSGLPTPDNKLVIDIYTYSYGDELTPVQHTEVPMTQEDNNGNVLMRYYSVGDLDFDGDFIPVGDKFNYILTVQKYQLNDDDNYLLSFFHADANGEITETIIEDANSAIFMNDINGKDRQYMFVVANDQTASTGTFHFIDIYTVNEVLALPSTLGSYSLKANVDRYPVGNSYEYAFETANVNVVDDCIIEDILWINTGGDVVRQEVLNLGKDIAIAQVYIGQDALNPYLFNTDPAREYMWLVKRYIQPGSTVTQEELLVVSTNGSTLYRAIPDESKGILANISILNINTNPQLQILYVNGRDYVTEVQPLPFTFFENGGDGSISNPYKIASVGDLQMIKENPAAHYEIIKDIDADGFTFSTITETFTGTLNGNNHTIKGISFNSKSGLFEMITGAEGVVSVKDIVFTGVNIYSASDLYVGVIAGEINTTTIENVHIQGLKFYNDTKSYTFGGIVGQAVLNSHIKNCSVTSADICLPMSESVGGIVGLSRTKSYISSCSFMGQLTAESVVGGIAGYIGSDLIVSNCHVDADIVANNTVGGIVGESKRGPITNCYVEGTVTALKSSSPNYDFGPCAGGIVGLINPESKSTGDSDEPVVYLGKTVTNCFVNLTALNGYTPASAPRFANEHTTIHRIAGKTLINLTPDIKDYDNDGKPIFDTTPPETEYSFENNYAIESLDRGHADIRAAEGTTEGADIASDALDHDWFAKTLGFEFSKDTWNEKSDWDPALSHETTNYANPAEITVEQGKTYDINVVFVSRIPVTEENVFDQFTFDCDENITTMTGASKFYGNTLSVEFTANKPGTTTVDICGAKCKVTVTEGNSSVGNIADDNNTPVITFDGTAIIANGCTLAVYNTSGSLVAKGNDAISVNTLAAGAYIATAINADGAKATAKVIVK